MNGAVYTAPEKLILAPLWENPAILKNKKPLKQANFPSLMPKIMSVFQLLSPGTNLIQNRAELENTYEIELNEESYIELRYIITTSFKNLGVRLESLPPIQYPIQPLLVNIALQIKKGCNIYYKYLRTCKNHRNLMCAREDKWHEELGVLYGVKFWNHTYLHTSCISNDNKLKWLQYQIVRNCLYTNYKVHKFKPNVSPLCSYCLEDVETVSHLYFRCRKTQSFWEEVKLFLKEVDIAVPLLESSILFGIHSEKPDSLANILILWVKSFIWNNKFKNSNLALDIFKLKVKQRLDQLKEALSYRGKEEEFNRWQPIFNILLD